MNQNPILLARNLWLECFEDPEFFVDFYFSHLVKEEDLRLHYVGDELAVHLHLPKYALSFPKFPSFQASYVSGACTKKEFRCQGLMTSMLQKSLLEERSCGIHASFLIPANEDLRTYYQRHFAYQTISYREICFGREAVMQAYPHDFSKEGVRDASHFLFLEEGERPVSGIKHSFDQWKHILFEYEYLSSQANLLVIRGDNGEILGLGLYRLEANHSRFFIDYLAGTELAKSEVLAQIQELDPSYAICSYAYSSSPSADSEAYVMLRPLDPLPFLQIFAAKNPELSWSFALEDELIPENSQTYILRNGSVELSPLKAELSYSIAEFTQKFIELPTISLLHD